MFVQFVLQRMDDLVQLIIRECIYIYVYKYVYRNDYVQM